MAYANYPSDVLPNPRADGYSFSVEPVVKRYRMDSGRWRQVQVATSQFHEAQCTWRLNDSELSLWKGFYNAASHQGTDPFAIDLGFGNGSQRCLATFASDYSYQHTGRMGWDLTASLRVEEIDAISNQPDLEAAGADLGLVGTDWLTALPKLQVGHSVAVESSNARTAKRSSRYFSRKRFDRSVHRVSVSWKLSDAELEYFKGWHKAILSYGSVAFEMDLALGGGYQANRARMVDGAYQVRHEGYMRWGVNFVLECDSILEDRTYAQYLSRLATAQSALPLRQPDGLGEPPPGTGPALIDQPQAESQDFLSKGGGTVPLRTAVAQSQDFTSAKTGEIALGSADAETT